MVHPIDLQTYIDIGYMNDGNTIDAFQIMAMNIGMQVDSNGQYVTSGGGDPVDSQGNKLNDYTEAPGVEIYAVQPQIYTHSYNDYPESSVPLQATPVSPAIGAVVSAASLTELRLQFTSAVQVSTGLVRFTSLSSKTR